MAELSPADVRRLAAAFEPVLYFADGERYFPVQAESWLSHVSAADWERSDGADLPAEDRAGAHGRGTALIRGGARVSAAPTPAGEALGPAEAALLRAGQPGDYLSFGGWLDATHAAGDKDYVYDAFAEYAAAMDAANKVAAFERDRQNRPLLWHAQPTTPTVYCEAGWARRYGEALLAGEKTRLEGFLALTYHYLFPVREEPTLPFGEGNAEGQWEAVTVFLAGDRLAPGSGTFVKGDHGDLLASFRPHAVVLSRPATMPVMCRSWETTDRLGTHPMVAVALRSHRLMFQPTEPMHKTAFGTDLARSTGQAPTVAGHTRLPVTDPGRDNGPFNDFWSTAAFFAGLALASPFIILAALLGRVLFGSSNDSQSGAADEAPTLIPSPHGDGAGSVARPGDGTAVPGSVVVPEPDRQPWAAYRVDDPATTILRVVDTFNPPAPSWWAAAESGAAPPVTEMPVWWGYPGRWGVMTRGLYSWGPGGHRTGLAEANARALTLAWASPEVDAPRRP